MPENIASADDTIYRIRRASSSRALVRRESKALVQRKAHDLVLHVTRDGYAGDQFFHWLGDLRRKRLHVYGGLLRFIDISVDRGVPKRILDLIPAWISEYIADQFSGDDGPSNIRKAA